MKKTGLIYILLLLSTFKIYAQNSFELLVENNNDQIITDVVELPDGSFVMTGISEYPRIQIAPQGFLIKVNEQGIITDSVALNDFSYCMLNNIHVYNNELYVIAALKESTDSVFYLGLLKFNMDLELLDVRKNILPGNKQIGFVNSIIDSDANLVMCGVVNNYNFVGDYLGMEGFLYKISMTGDSISSRFFIDNTLKLPSGIIEKNDSTGYHLFIRYYDNHSNSSKILLNKNLEDISVLNLSSETYNYALHSSNYTSPVRINDSVILIGGRYYLNETFFTFTMSDNDSVITGTYIENENMIQSAINYGNSKNGNHIYSGYTSNVSINNLFFSHDTSNIHVVKFDEELNTLWHKVIGGDAYYMLYGVLACNDGDCLIVAYKYDYQNNTDNVRNLYIAKLNQNGDLSWQEDIPVSGMISLYPDPAKKIIYLSLADNVFISEYKIFNLRGDIILNSHSFSGAINIDALSPGTYVLQLNTNVGLVSRQFVKLE